MGKFGILQGAVTLTMKDEKLFTSKIAYFIWLNIFPLFASNYASHAWIFPWSKTRDQFHANAMDTIMKLLKRHSKAIFYR